MGCAEHDKLREQWIAMRAEYQIALADLQTPCGGNEFRAAVRRANQAFAEYFAAESQLNEHLRAHNCSIIPAGPPFIPVQTPR